jgi:outer membrane immunogenic protein
MRRLIAVLVATSALTFAAQAADLPAKAPVYKVPPVAMYKWTGIYLGANGGGGWGTGHFCTDAFAGAGSCANGDIADHNLSGWLAGGQLGYRYQITNCVFGIEGMWDAARIKGDNPSPLTAAPNRIRGTDIKSLYSVTGSVGYAWDRWLFYAKGGWAGARVDLNADNLNAGGFTMQTSTNYDGYTVGGGVEAFVWQNLSVGVEYDYYGLRRGDITNLANSGGVVNPCSFCDVNAHVHTVTARVNYTFNWP